MSLLYTNILNHTFDKFYQILLTDSLILCYQDDSTTYNSTHWPYLNLPLLSTVSPGHRIRVINFTNNGQTYVRAHVTDHNNYVNSTPKAIVKGWASNGQNHVNEASADASYRCMTFICFESLDGSKRWFHHKQDTN